MFDENKIIRIKKAKGKRVIGTGDLCYCNTRWHKPYLCKLMNGEIVDQERISLGNGSCRETYYVVERIQPGDLIQAAGGSGNNTSPFTGRVISITNEELVVESISNRDWSNLVAGQKREPVNFNQQELDVIQFLLELPDIRREVLIGKVFDDTDQ